MDSYKVEWDLLPWQSPLKGVRFKVFQKGNRKARLVEYGRDFAEPDWCTKGHIGLVLEGEFEINFDGCVVRYRAGDGIFIPEGAQARHMAHILSDRVRVVLVEDI